MVILKIGKEKSIDDIGKQNEQKTWEKGSLMSTSMVSQSREPKSTTERTQPTKSLPYVGPVCAERRGTLAKYLPPSHPVFQEGPSRTDQRRALSRGERWGVSSRSSVPEQVFQAQGQARRADRD